MEEIEKHKALAEYQDYFSLPFVQFELVKLLRNKEFSVLPSRDFQETGVSVRGMNCGGIDYIRLNSNRFNFFTIPHKLYFSLAYFNSLPVLSWNLKQRKEEYKEINSSWNDRIKGFDFFLDLDSPVKGVIKGVKRQSNKLANLFDSYSLPYSVKFSGKKGYHFVIEWRFLQPFFEKKPFLEVISCFERLAFNLSEIEGLKMIDLSIFDASRICKLDYSLDWSDSWRVVLPLNRDQLKNWDLNDFKASNVLKSVQIKNRGRIISLNSENNSGLEKFLKDFG
jgi:hypothetical protein